jgi:hypothetical protein
VANDAIYIYVTSEQSAFRFLKFIFGSHWCPDLQDLTCVVAEKVVHTHTDKQDNYSLADGLKG